ncbi:electrogenic sodium bicarbonate cotransporter 1-like isoform X1 [Lates japonicus]
MSATSSTRLSPSPNLLQVNEPKRYGSTLSLEEKCEQSFFLFYYYRMEDEAVLDRGASLLKHICDEEEVEGHHTIYIGVRVPKSYRRRRRHRRRTGGHKDRKERLTESTSDKSDTENNDEASNSILKPLSKF